MAEIDSTKAGVTANSYASVDQADDYLENTYGADEWTNATEPQKEQLLVTATRTINRLRVKFARLTETQALKLPVNTNSQIDAEGRALGDGYNQATEATIIQALYILTHGDELEEAEGNRIQGTTGESVAGKLTKSYSGLNPMARISIDAVNILKPYIDMTLSAVR